MASLRLSQMWEDHLGRLFDTVCVILWCWLCAGSADCGRLGNQTPEFSYCFKFIWSL